ncbi:MAG TPA: tRNA (adenosine(37)-N6)-threonylcarbamoyltransferase complex dimerization subunit type 1 TsaB [Kiritimatiellia bacterium]|nr:tRNA (adenosine(37)-N6)-threonylcarbamoyltransferase complex dimerization subunit type 1 TsaB [Kiritimatiellia bacterium]HNR93401.1 tRNA (adenosine(37)-N6)-threonylcarbamoyltransferase complex dimerization subunit type 1 TsaB [Kiritimatiellia bacterium]HNS80319.1 tRNA (adenosine(37)-N6)-threonylcarbamoyltransferase complex dimerization subunit type 1 TsaB [Kiritimatiellia bacterium]HPA77215.1 tRNA (adenosine(37)-N6)-threonylcarbamoyltransferase complex dimerization subunit type 1 TsaB [Kiriti
MKILAVELSAFQGSAALSGPDDFSLQEVWDQERGRHEGVFSRLSALLSQAGWGWGDVDCFAAGRGPGIYSGLRTALTCAQTLALPGEKSVYCVSSGAVLARGASREMNASRVAVVGDARRSLLWYGVFDFSLSETDSPAEWQMVKSSELCARLPAGVPVVSSDWERLEPNLAAQGLDGLNWIRGNRYPRARDLAALVRLRMEQGLPSEKPVPVYMHPPVLIAPRFPPA